MGTGLIYGAIVVVWAAFLLPWALRRYDEASRARSVEKFSTAMRVLGRRDGREPATLAAPRGLADQPAAAVPSGATAVRPSRAAARAAARRRRRTLLVLLGLTALGLLVAVFSALPLWAALVPLVVVVGFLAVCRREVRREDEATWEHHGATAAPSWPAAAVEPAAQPDSAGDPPDDEPTIVLSESAAAALAEASAVAMPLRANDGSSLWDPVSVNLPTYVSKPPAARTVRTVELGEPGTSTSDHLPGEPAGTPPPSEEPAAEPQRAVGS